MKTKNYVIMSVSFNAKSVGTKLGKIECSEICLAVNESINYFIVILPLIFKLDKTIYEYCIVMRTQSL